LPRSNSAHSPPIVTSVTTAYPKAACRKYAPGRCRAELRVGGDHEGALSAASEHHARMAGYPSDQRVRTVLCRGWRWRTGVTQVRGRGWWRALVRVSQRVRRRRPAELLPAPGEPSVQPLPLHLTATVPCQWHESAQSGRPPRYAVLCPALPCRYPFVHPHEDLNPRPQCVPQQRANHWGLAVLSRSLTLA
jgi:hypothetical protein